MRPPSMPLGSRPSGPRRMSGRSEPWDSTAGVATAVARAKTAMQSPGPHRQTEAQGSPTAALGQPDDRTLKVCRPAIEFGQARQWRVCLQVCRYFMAGDCMFGDRCRYAHPSRDEAAALQPPPTNVSASRSGGGWQARRSPPAPHTTLEPDRNIHTCTHTCTPAHVNRTGEMLFWSTDVPHWLMFEYHACTDTAHAAVLLNMSQI